MRTSPHAQCKREYRSFEIRNGKMNWKCRQSLHINFVSLRIRATDCNRAQWNSFSNLYAQHRFEYWFNIDSNKSSLNPTRPYRICRAANVFGTGKSWIRSKYICLHWLRDWFIWQRLNFYFSREDRTDGHTAEAIAYHSNVLIWSLYCANSIFLFD